MKTRLLALVAFVAMGFVTPAARASIIVNFDPNGTSGAKVDPVATFDQSPGNALAVGAILPSGVLNPAPFTLLYQARLGQLLDANGLFLDAPGATTPLEITVVASFQEIAIGTGLATAKFITAPNQAGSFIRFYAHASKASDLAGTGFTAGDLILDSQVLPVGGGSFGVTDPTPVALDQHLANNYPGLNTVTGGGGSLTVATVTFADPRFFLTNVVGNTITFDTQNNTPFKAVDPSVVMFEGTPAATLASLGILNGVTGPNFLFASDASSTFELAVPEPASLVSTGLGLGLLGLGALRARRKRKTA